jgi:hypothetical protein
MGPSRGGIIGQRIRGDGTARHLDVCEGSLLIFLMVERMRALQSASIMGPSQKMTKQGVRDLNHQVPKKRPAALEPQSSPVDEAQLVVPAAIVVEAVVSSPIEP